MDTQIYFVEQRKNIAEKEKEIGEPRNEDARMAFHVVNQLTNDDILGLFSFGDGWEKYYYLEEINNILVVSVKSVLKRTWSPPSILQGINIDIIYGSKENHAGITEWNNRSIKVNIGTYRGIERFGEILSHEITHYEQYVKYHLARHNLLVPAGTGCDNFITEAHAQYIAQSVSGTNRWGIGSLKETIGFMNDMGLSVYDILTGKMPPSSVIRRKFWNEFVDECARVKFDNVADIPNDTTKFHIRKLTEEYLRYYTPYQQQIELEKYIEKQIKFHFLPPVFEHVEEILGEDGHKEFLDLAGQPDSKEFQDFVESRFNVT